MQMINGDVLMCVQVKMSKRRSAALTEAQCVSLVCLMIYDFRLSSYRSVQMCVVDVLVCLCVQAQKLLRERLCHQKLPDRPVGLDSQYKWVQFTVSAPVCCKCVCVCVWILTLSLCVCVCSGTCWSC